MNWKKLLLSCLCALAALSLSFFLPDLVGAARQRALLQGAEQRSAEKLELVFDRMALSEKLASAVSVDMELVTDAGTRLSREDARARGREILLFFKETGFCDRDPDMPDLECDAQAVCANTGDGTESFICWIFGVSDAGQTLEAYLILDDESGALLGFSNLPQDPSHRKLPLADVAAAWGMLYAGLTDLEFVEARPSDIKTLIYAASDVGNSEDTYTDLSEQTQWELVFRGQDGAALSLSFCCIGGHYYFNIF